MSTTTDSIPTATAEAGDCGRSSPARGSTAFRVLEGEKPEPKDFCEVCQKPNCTSWTVLDGRRAFACSDECSDMVQRMRQANELKVNPPPASTKRRRLAKVYEFPSNTPGSREAR